MPQVSNGGVVSLGLDLTIDPLLMKPESSSEKIDLLRYFNFRANFCFYLDSGEVYRELVVQERLDLL